MKYNNTLALIPALLLAACGGDLQGLRDAALLSLGYDAGLRVSELAREARAECTQRLRHGPQRSVLEARQHVGESRKARLEALGVQGQRRIVGGNVEVGTRIDAAFVDAVGNRMPGDAVAFLTGQQRPARRVQPGISGQRTIVEVDGAAAGALNQAFGTTAFTEGLILGTATVRGKTH